MYGAEVDLNARALRPKCVGRDGDAVKTMATHLVAIASDRPPARDNAGYQPSSDSHTRKPPLLPTDRCTPRSGR
jgi:hypothetical protein